MLAGRKRFLGAAAALIACLAGVVIVAPDAYADATPGADGLGDRLFPRLGNGGYDARAYDVSFDFEAATMTMTGTSVMQAVATQALSRFNLDSAGQGIHQVTVNGKPARFRTDGEELVVNPGESIPSGSPFTVAVTYTADRSVKDGWANLPDGGFALTGGAARQIFPCNDYPSDKARMSMHVTVPAGFTAVAIGVQTHQSESNSRTRYDFTSQHPVQLDSMQLAIGKLAVRKDNGPNGLPLRSAVPVDLAAVLPRVHDLTRQHLAWLEQKIGRPFPFEIYGVLGVPGAFPYETQTLSVVQTSVLDGKDTSVLVHELTHQYFEDAVSTRSFDDKWLSEGHATFYAALYDDEHDGAKLAEALAAWRNMVDSERPTQGPPARPNSPDFANDIMARVGGALALYALRERVGTVAFGRIEQALFDRYRDNSASTGDFIEVANQVTGQDLTEFLRSWLYGTSTPPLPAAADHS